MHKAAEEQLNGTGPPESREDRVRQAVAYLDLWERNVCLKAIEGKVPGLSGSRGSAS